MAVDPAFTGAGREVGIVLWRIENKRVVKQPQANGKFHTGDSYIMLVTKAKGSALDHAIHFWLGAETSQDEQGIAAYKTVELDEGLGGGPVQYREVQGGESPLFLSYFKDGGVEYLPGGVESGFAHVDRDAFRTRLLHIKGKRTVRVAEVQASNRSLNTGDVFILDLGMKLFLWNGAQANRNEKAKAVETIQKIKNQERGGRANITVMDEDPNNADFWGALGGKINVTNAGEDDEVHDRTAAASVHLFRVSDASGSLEFTEIQTEDGRLRRDMLDHNDVFLLDDGANIYIWVGRGATQNEKREGMTFATNYLQQAGRPNTTPVMRVADASETPVFKALFMQWDPPAAMNVQPTSSGIAKKQEQKAISMDRMHSKTVDDDTPVDDGSGRIQIWRIENFAKVEVPQALYGQFFGGDSYVMLYTYRKGSADEYIIYFWQGRDSSTDEKGASALLAKELDDQLGGKPVQVRVVQGKEPKHFRSLFRGRMLVHAGGKASGFKNKADKDSYDADGVALFHVKGTGELNTYGCQVPETASSLNSGDCFVLVTPTNIYRWYGHLSNHDERRVANNIAGLLGNYNGVTSRRVADVNEGSEPADFWSAVGGRAAYAQAREGEEVAHEARLFQCSNATGVFAVDEVVNFTQEDLCDDDVMICDVFTTVYVWIGSQSNQQEKQMSMETAQNYINTSPDGRDQATSIISINAGSEPIMFSQHFPGWDPTLTQRKKFVDPYQARLQALHGASGGGNAPAAAGAAFTGSYLPTTTKVRLADIRGREDLDPSRKEDYLSDADFNEAFKMTRAQFAGQPKWKQQTKKREAGMF